MTESDGGARAVIVLVVGDREITLGPVPRAVRCDLVLVDDILRLQLAVRRLGWSIRLRQVDAELRGLIDLVGVAECLGL